MKPHFRKPAVVALAVAVLAAVPGIAAADAPMFADPNERQARIDLSGLPRLRFLTTLDFPPFNFADSNRKPSGFNVELARALCAEMGIEAKCEIQAMPWEELDGTLDGRRGEAIIAGHGISASLRAGYLLTPAYFRFPARFAGRRDVDPLSTDMAQITAEKKIAVVRGSAHAAMLKAWFPEAVPVEEPTMQAAYAALNGGEADLVFGDGVTLAFWLASEQSDSCCRFVSGPYLSEHFLGGGMTIVTRRDNDTLSEALTAALTALEKNGTYDEIYTRYFPLDPYGDGVGEVKSKPPEGKAQRPEQSG